MSGHVFHPGHDDLHGLTVVVYTHGPKTVVGRWHAIENGRVLLHDAAVHDSGSSEQTREEFVAQQKKYGVAVQERDLTLPQDSVSDVVLLREVGSQPGAL